MTRALGKPGARGLSNDLRAVDGPGEPARLVADLGSWRVSSFESAGSYAAFSLQSPTVLWGLDLWRTDGTPEGTFPLISVATHFVRSSTIASVRGLSVFSLSTGGLGTEPWVTDGTREGTRLLRDIAPGGDASTPQWFVRRGSTVLFSAWETAGSRAVWSTDGTPEGTVRGVTLPAELVSSEWATGFGRGLFVVDSATAGIWYVDMERAERLFPSTNSTTFVLGSALGQRFFITRRTASSLPVAFDVYATDGTAAGTRIISTLTPPQNPACLMPSGTIADGTLYVRYDDGVEGPELYAMKFCPGDYNLDGQVDFFDYLDYAMAFNAEVPGADFDGNAQIDFFDYLDFITAFSAGC